mmetsp:Transcript_12951/g.23035  ORF Transcript_12951/g.23035 Transcript_12951/m.23035 type:complete len:285 (-) Transcript_12951:1549-2403(-)
MEVPSTGSLDRLALLSPGNSARGSGRNTETVVVEADSSLLKIEKLDDRVISEIVSCLKVKSSMLAHGACERVKKIAKMYTKELVITPILPELVNIVKDGPGTPLAVSALSTLAILALSPEGRQRIVMCGVLTPIIRLIERSDPNKPNIDKSLTLLMNLAADQVNRRIMRTEGVIEAVVGVLKQMPQDQVLEHSLGTIHNIALLDNKSKQRALDAGILAPLVKIILAKTAVSDTSIPHVRAKMFLAELSKLPGVDVQIEELTLKFRMSNARDSSVSMEDPVEDQD